MIALLAALVLAQAEPAPAAVSERPSASKDPEALKSETPAADAAAPFEPVTKVDGKSVEVALGSRAVLHLSDEGLPLLDKAESGPLAAAHPIGKYKEVYAAPDKGQVAFALDGSVEKKASYLKVWNGLGYPVAYRAIVLRMLPGGKRAPEVVRTCAVAPGATDLLTWPHPIVSIAITEITKAADAKACK